MSIDWAPGHTRLGDIRTFTRRTGRMGTTASPDDVLPTLPGLEPALNDLGARRPARAGVAAAQAVFAGSA